jgi:hypothetical protein
VQLERSRFCVDELVVAGAVEPGVEAGSPFQNDRLEAQRSAFEQKVAPEEVVVVEGDAI